MGAIIPAKADFAVCHHKKAVDFAENFAKSAAMHKKGFSENEITVAPIRF